MRSVNIKPNGLIGPLAIAISVTLVIILSLNRDYLTYGTETDFLGGFLPEAQRIINGEALNITFHPPFYSLTVAIAYLVFSDWFFAGRIISIIAGILVIVSSYLLFNNLGNRYMAVGSVISLMISPLFLTYSALATSDAFFLALYMTSLLCLYAASQKQTSAAFLWILSGILIGLTILTRTNGVVIALLVFYPLLQEKAPHTRLKSFLLILSSLCLTLLVWVLISLWTNSPMWPTSTYANLAMSYFSPTDDRIGGESRRIVADQFESVSEVLFHDPTQILRIYVTDILKLGARVVVRNTILLFPLGLLGFIGAVSFLIHNRKDFSGNSLRFTYFLLFVTLMQVLFVNFMGFDARFYLFLIPILGAFSGNTYQLLVTRIKPASQQLVNVALSVFLFLAIVFSIREASGSLVNYELRDAVPRILGLIEPPCTIFARKSHIAFYAGCQSEYLPDLPDLESLRIMMTENAPDHPTFVFYGDTELWRRPQFKQLQYSNNSPTWLKPVVESDASGWWILYEFRPSCINSSCN